MSSSVAEIANPSVVARAPQVFRGEHERGHSRPRIGFLGVGWIGRKRMEAIAKSGLAEICAVADSSEERLSEVRTLAPNAALYKSMDALLELDLDGVVIATPSALHAQQAIAALQRGLAVFCQKPLARTAAETRRVIEAARQRDRLLAVDLSYRFIQGVQLLRDHIRSGAFGKIFAAEMVFHNAYGPDKSWFYDRQLSGGGCVIDLGIHLLDLALWCLDFPAVAQVTSRLYARGHRLVDLDGAVEDFANARLDIENGANIQLSCSWNLSAGRDAVIRAAFFGTQGAGQIRNVDGSFYDFVTERFRGTQRETMASPPEDWCGGAVLDWTRRLARSPRYDHAIEEMLPVARALDRIYGQ